jgi:hypothetical protein
MAVKTTYKYLMYEWIRSDTKHPFFSVDEMLSLSDFADWLDEHAAYPKVVLYESAILTKHK